ncbi:hypothetical protein [Brevundimonas sp.]|uniref:hypothetical protein n=1 Tax=Brevundimonas sp. TaxID=1871086 RepID=UPI00391DEA02
MILTALAVLVLSDQPIATAGRSQGHVPAPTAAEEPVAPSITGARAMSTDEQIAAWIGASPAAQLDMGEGPLNYDAPFEPEERRIRGEVSAAIGSHGYQAFGVGVSIPLGESGQLNLHYSESEGRFGGYSPYYHPGYGGYGLRSGSYFGAPDPWRVYGADGLTPRSLRTRGITAIPDDEDW